MKEITFQNEDQLIAAEDVYNTAVSRILQMCPEKTHPTDSYLESVWNSIAQSVIYTGYKEAMDYARTANFNPVVKKHLEKERELEQE